tara:strand:+ start:205 stop:1047 length:843 start_codon:yes stop_codon:yes gene_type:complete
MAILLDYSQVSIANLMQQDETDVSIDLFRHMVLRSIKYYRTRFIGEYGEVIICCDSTNYWRKKVFPQYKINRKRTKQYQTRDWDLIFTCLNQVRDELKESFPYIVLQVDTTEADDIIAIICQMEQEDNIIVSGDKDFLQLQKHDGVNQYSPNRRDMITVDNPEQFKKLHIMRGDSGDGVPNFLSPDNTFADQIRQKPLSNKKLNEWSNMEPEIFCDIDMMKGYKRNRQLVDLDYIPEDIREKILSEYKYQLNNGYGDRSKLLPYFIKHQLKQLTEVIHEF